jgi:DNA-binding HxlR family transcriptional regulator
MERKSFAGMDCSVAQCLEIVGEWWTMLIVRDAFLGVTRFDVFQERLGISRNVLQQRLERLVQSGIFEREAYSEHPPGRSSTPCANGAINTQHLMVRRFDWCTAVVATRRSAPSSAVSAVSR